MTQITSISSTKYPTITETLQTPDSKISPLTVKRTFSEHTMGVTSLGILDESRFISGSRDASIKTWDKSSERSLKTQYPDKQSLIEFMQLFPDKTCVAIGWAFNDAMNKTIKIYNTLDGRSHDLLGHQDKIYSLAISKVGLLASGSFDNAAKIWEPFSSKVLYNFTYNTNPGGRAISGVGFLPDGKTFVCGTYDTGEIQFWEMRHPTNRKPDNIFHTPAKINSLLVMKNGMIATGSADARVRIWDPSEPPETALKITLEGHFGHVPALAERPDGLLVSGSSDRSIILWDIETGDKWISPNNEHTNTILAIEVFDDNSVLSASLDGTVKLWTETPKKSRL